MRFLPPQFFSRLCLGLAAFVFIGIYPGLTWFAPNALPLSMQDYNPEDFVPYYTGAVVARHGIWDSLYPIPKPEVFSKPPTFVPYEKTFLFHPSDKNSALYPMLTELYASDCAPRLLDYFPEATTGYRYMYPPPTALLLWPLSLGSFDLMAHRIWPTLCYCAYFLTAFFSARLYRLLSGAPSYLEGAIILACLVVTYRGPIDVATGNVTPILSALIALAAYVLIKGRLVAFSAILIPLVLFKSIGFNWLPLLFLKRQYWPALVYLAILTLIINGIVLSLGGFVAYTQFAALSSKILVPIGEGVVPSLLHLLGIYPRTFFYLLNAVILGAIYYNYWRKSRAPHLGERVQTNALLLLAVLAGTMSLFCLTNFSVWRAYSTNYVFLPFMGWLFREGCLAEGKWRILIRGGILSSFALLACHWMIMDAFSLVHSLMLGKLFTLFYKAVLLVFMPVFFLAVSLRRVMGSFPAQDIATI